MSTLIYKNNLEQLYKDCSRNKKKAVMVNNMRNYLAKRNSTIIWGNGFIFESESEQLEKEFTEFSRKQRLLELMFYTEEQLSKYGRAVISLNKTKDGSVRLNLTDNMYLNAVGKTFCDEYLAVVWQRIYYDNTAFFIKSTYDKEKCINELLDDKNELVVWDKAKEIMETYQVEPVWNHNLGFVPVVEMGNYPNIKTFPMQPTWTEQTDWYNAAIFEGLYWQAYLDFKKELVLCHSRILLENGTQQQIQKIQDTFGRDGELDDDDINYIMKDIIIETGVGGKTSIMTGPGDFTKYSQAMDNIMDFYCKFANSARFSEGGGAQKSTQEIKTTRSAQVEAINTKIMFREQKLTELIHKWFSAMGLSNYDEKPNFTFKINGNIQKDDTVFLDNIIKQTNLGTMSMVEAISKLRNIPLSKAHEIFESIKEFNDDNGIITQTSDIATMDNEGEMNDGGRPAEQGDSNE